MQNLRTQWVNECLKIACTPATFYSGARKIIRPHFITFTSLDDSLRLSDAGYTKSKLTMLIKNYLHVESQQVAVELWQKRRGQAKYGSVGFTCYNHFKKGDVSGATPRGSVFGPCLQSVVITWIDKTHYSLDVYWRTTEFFKKFAPDLVFLRDILVKPFDFKGMNLKELNCHFANLTSHSMYICTVFPHLADPVKSLENIKRKDKFFATWSIKWTARYLCKEYEHGIKKFAQALRVQKDVLERLDKNTLKNLQKYLRKNHPGYTHTRFSEDPDEAIEAI